MAIKRLHYFDHQFLVEKDFTDEQQYHLGMRRRLNKSLYTAGIADGLVVAKTAPKMVTVRPGVAFDNLGQEMIVEADQVVDLSDATKFTTGATVFITIAYQEEESDQTPATGVSGNTRVTEKPNVQPVVTTTPPTGGMVIPLASFRLIANAEVPGPIDAPLDGGVRQMIRPRVQPLPQGLGSINNVSNPGGNVNLVVPPGPPPQAIVITPNDATNQITISENHSTQTGDVHKLAGSDLQRIGALLASDYDLGRRGLALVSFINTPTGTGVAEDLINSLNFRPRIVLVVGFCTATLSGSRVYGGGVTAFADLETNLDAQRGFGVKVTKFTATDWISEPVDVNGIATAEFVDNSVAPARVEKLVVAISAVSNVGLTARLTRTSTGGGLPFSFKITLHLLCMGAVP